MGNSDSITNFGTAAIPKHMISLPECDHIISNINIVQRNSITEAQNQSYQVASSIAALDSTMSTDFETRNAQLQLCKDGRNHSVLPYRYTNYTVDT